MSEKIATLDQRAQAIARQYRIMGCVPAAGDEFVWDGRSLNMTGPYTKGQGVVAAQQFCDMVHRNSPLGDIFPNAVCVGPFFPVTPDGKAIPRKDK